MELGSFIHYRGVRIDCCRRLRGCYKVRHLDGKSYVIIDFATVTAAKAFIRRALESKGEHHG